MDSTGKLEKVFILFFIYVFSDTINIWLKKKHSKLQYTFAYCKFRNLMKLFLENKYHNF